MQRTPESCAVKTSPIDKINRGGGFRRNFKRGVRNEPFIYTREVRAVGPLRGRWRVRGICVSTADRAGVTISMSKPRPDTVRSWPNPTYLHLLFYSISPLTFPK